MAQGDAYVLEGDRMLFGIDAGASGASSRAPIGGAAKGAPPAPAAAAAAAAKYERAAATGNVAAMVRLAALALRARPEARGDDAGDALPPRNLRAARKWLERAAESGSADAHLALGKMFEESPEADASTPAPHEDAGARSAKDAAGGGDAAGWEPTVGETPAAARDHAAAAKHYGKAADAGLVDAKAALGYLYETGLGVRQNAVRAVQLYREAAEKGHAKAQNNLGSMYFQGSGGLTQDPAKAVEWYRRAARGGSGSAANNLGICYEDGIGVDADPTKAEELYARAAAAGNMHAQNNIAYMKVANRDYAAAELWFRRAAEQGSHDALHNLGGMAEHGLGMPVSLELAVHLYDRASAGGSEASAAAAEGAKAAMEARTGEMAAAEANIAELARAREDLKAAQASIVTLEAAAARGAAANAQAAADKAALEAQVTDLKQLNDTFRSLSRNHSMKSNGSDGSSGMGTNGSMQMLTTGSAQGQSLRPMGGHAKGFQKLALAADSRRRDLVQRLIDTLSTSAAVQMPDGSERPMNSAERKESIKEVKRRLDVCSEKVALGGRSAISACEVAVEDAQYMTKKMDDMVVRMFKRILALEEQVRNLGLVPVLPEGTDIETSMMACLG